MKRLLFTLFVLSSITLTAQTTPDYLPTNGLVGWWPFNGNATDNSGKGNNGTVLNAVLTTDRFGNLNAAYNFNGISSRIEIADAASLRCRKITMSAWIFSNNTVPKQVIYKGSINGDNEGYSLNSSPTTGYKISSNCNSGAGWQGASFKKTIVAGTWEHFVATFDGVTSKLYRNGVFDTSYAINGLIDSCIGGGLRFGFNHLRFNASTGDPFNGGIDDIGIWNRALEDKEVRQLYSGVADCGNGNVGVNVCIPARNLHIKDVLRLEPRDSEPSNPGKGDIYFDSILNKLRVYDGTVWQNCW